MRNEELTRAQLPTTLSRHAWHVIACYMYVQFEAKRATQAVEQLYFFPPLPPLFVPIFPQ